MAEFNISDLEKIDKSQDILDLLVEKGIIKEKKFKEQLAYEKHLAQLQYEMLRLQTYISEKGLRVLIIFEGRDAAGKGGTITRCISSLNPKLYRVVALPKPTDLEKGQWYFQRYVEHLPNAGEIVFFDRSYYNRSMVEPVFGFCTKEQYKAFVQQVIPFEQNLVEDGMILIKIFLDINKEEQERRLQERKDDPMKHFKIGVLDEQALEKWDDYTKYIDKMLTKTATKSTPWFVFDANNKRNTRIHVMSTIIDKVKGYKPELKIKDILVTIHPPKPKKKK